MNLQIRANHAPLFLGQHCRGAARMHEGEDHAILDVFDQRSVPLHPRAGANLGRAVLLHRRRTDHPTEETDMGDVNVEIDRVRRGSVVEDGLLQRMGEVEPDGTAAQRVEEEEPRSSARCPRYLDAGCLWVGIEIGQHRKLCL